MDSNIPQSDGDEGTNNTPPPNQFANNWAGGAPMPGNVYYAYPSHPDGLMPVPPPSAYGYYHQYPPQPVYFPPQIIPPQALNEDPLDDQDDLNQLEIDQELLRTENSPSPHDEYTEYHGDNDEDLAVMDELEAEIDKMTAAVPSGSPVVDVVQPIVTIPVVSSGSRDHNKHLPVGATPGQGGVLNAHASEFWFPECRSCTCCHGFKHGCACCKNGVIACENENCVDQDFKLQVASTLAARESTQPSSHVSSSPSQIRTLPAPHTQSRISATQSGGYGYNIQAPTQASSYGGAPAGNSSSPCRYFLQGSCRFGTSCHFQHTGMNMGMNMGMRSSPQYPSMDTTSLPIPRPSGDVGMCREDSRCRRKGTGCTLRHTPCRFLVSGVYCPFGESCRYSHVSSDVQAASLG